MAKKPSINNITTGYTSAEAINENFQNVRNAFDNTLSLDGSTPNAMGADLNMDSNDILNVGEINVQGLSIAGVNIYPNNTQIATTYATQNYTGNGSTTTYAMGYNPSSKANVDVYIDGVYQNQDAFNITGTSLTFTAAPPLNSAIEIKVPINVTSLTNTDSSQIVYNQGGTGAVTTNVKAKLQEFVSVKDFGAVGDGTTDDRAAFQAAVNAAQNGVMFVPSGTYYISDPGITINNDNITIIGTEHTFLKCELITFVDHGDGTYTVGQGNVINAVGVDNITIKDITIIGGYQSSWGNAYVYQYSLGTSTGGKKLLWLNSCNNITLDNFTLTNVYGSSMLFATPEDRVESVWGYAPVGISGGDDIRLLNCNHIVSSSEAWSIYDCTNVLVDGCIFDTNYGVSYLDITYCTDVIVTNCQFMKRLISDAGELLNAASSRMTVDSNKFLNGNCDVGNEYLNANLTIGATFLLYNQVVSNNTLYNGIITCSTSNGTYSLTWAQENVVISNNTVTIDVDTRPAASGSTVLNYAGISLPRYKNARNFLVSGNTILLKGAMQTTGPNPKLYNSIALIDAKMLTTGLQRENFSITNNRLLTDITSYDPDDINDDSGSIIFDYGNWKNLVIDNNYIDGPVGIYFKQPESIERMSISGNKIYGEAGIVIPYEAVDTDFTSTSITNNEFEFWNTATHTYTSSDFANKGLGFFLTHVIGQTSTMPNTIISNNNVKAVGFAYISNAQTSASIDLDLTLANNDVDFIDYANVSAFTIEPMRLARANTANDASTVRLVNNYFVDSTASGVTFNIYEVDKLDFINNVWEGTYTLNAASDNLAAVTDSRFVRKNNMAFGTLTVTYTNLSTAVTQVDDGNSGGF